MKIGIELRIDEQSLKTSSFLRAIQAINQMMSIIKLGGFNRS
jgi:hypothetical protein